MIRCRAWARTTRADSTPARASWIASRYACRSRYSSGSSPTRHTCTSRARPRDSYGYAIIQRVRELSQGQIAWTDGMLYPVLHRLESQGHVESRWGVAENGRKRKYYALRAAGREALRAHREQWLVVYGALAKL